MIAIPGWLISLLTFPGVIVHVLAYKLFCNFARISVHKVCYFRLSGSPAGYVIHDPVKSLKNSFLISIAPLIVNTVLCMLITHLSYSLRGYFGFLVFWVGFSIGMHAFPSNETAKNFLQAVKNSRRGGVLLFFARIFYVLLKVANALSFLWFDAIYAFIISVLLPLLIRKMIVGIV